MFCPLFGSRVHVPLHDSDLLSPFLHRLSINRVEGSALQSMSAVVCVMCVPANMESALKSSVPVRMLVHHVIMKLLENW
jgi:hypothetical protein